MSYPGLSLLGNFWPLCWEAVGVFYCHTDWARDFRVHNVFMNKSTCKYTYLNIYNPYTKYIEIIRIQIRSAFNKFLDFFVQVFKIIINSWQLRMLLLYILWDDWPIFRISGSNEQLQQQLEYTLLKPDCHSWWISKMQWGHFRGTICNKILI